MAINYTFSVGNVTKKLQYEGFSDVIISASFGVNAQTDEAEPAQFSYSCGGYKEFSIAEIDPDNFVSFENVTYETVVGWLLASEGVETLNEFSYVKSSVDNIRARIAELQVQVNTSVSGNSSFNGSVTSEQPTPEPEPTPEPTPEL